MNAETGLARNTDPDTAKAAAKSVNASALEKVVLKGLQEHGPMTMEETAFIMNKSINSLGPRFRPLLEKNMIYEVMSGGYNLTRAGGSGRQRQVYAIQERRELWRERPIRKSKTQLQMRIEHLEAALTEIRDVARVSEGVEFYAMLAEKGLAND
tara:strand:+ start:3686 stop:4147 length:462 start_codon:yes stop_codon:yes gene_type:complete